MSLRQDADKSQSGSCTTISFGERFINSDQFRQVFAEGMGLVEEAAGYLDGPGRKEARDLPSDVSFAYATESMRLTTRLMQMASWLLIRRAVNEGEMSEVQADEEEHRVKLQTVGHMSRAENFDELPERLRELVERSLHFYQRIIKLDAMLKEQRKSKNGDNGTSPLNSQLERLHSVYGSGS